MRQCRRFADAGAGVQSVQARPLGHVDDLFRFVPAGHAFAEHVRRFGSLVVQEESYLRLAESAGAPLVARKLLRLTADDPEQLRWLYLSLQRADPAGRFDAVTWFYSARKRRVTTWVFPDDPYLAALPAHRSGERMGARVLQYVPRHRLVYVTEDRRVAKLMRPLDLAGVYDRLRRVHVAVSRADVGFDVAAPLGIDAERGVFFQSLLPGRDLASALTEANLGGLLRGAGAIMADVHRLDVPAPARPVPEGPALSGPALIAPALGIWSAESFLRAVGSHVALVSLFRPREGVHLAGVLALLARFRPEVEVRDLAFCHGDLRCGHILRHEARWSVIDFDGCRLGDPLQDLARLLAFLKRDVPLLRERFAFGTTVSDLVDDAVHAFVQGYETRRGASVDPRRLRWYLIAHELHYLARMFKRDLYDEVSFERGVERVLRLAHDLRREPAVTIAVPGGRP